MKKSLLTFMAVLLSVTVLCSPEVQAEEPTDEHIEQQEVELTEKQQKKLEKLHKQIFKKQKKLISKYVEYGVIPEEKAEKIISHMEKHLEMLKENGFIYDHNLHKEREHDRESAA